MPKGGAGAKFGASVLTLFNMAVVAGSVCVTLRYTLDQALKIDPKKIEALYNRACYNALLGGDINSIADDLKRAFELSPKLREIAKSDHDLDGVRNDMKIKPLIDDSSKQE